MLINIEVTPYLLAALDITDPVTDSDLADAITARHAHDNQVIDSVYNDSRAAVEALAGGAEEAGWIAATPELAPLCEATGCTGCHEHWRTSIYGSVVLLGYPEVHEELAAIYTAAGLTLTLSPVVTLS